MSAAGSLREVIEAAAAEAELPLRAMTVLSDGRDPYRLDTPAGHRLAEWTPAGHRLAEWFARQVEDKLADQRVIHLRGLFYLIVAVGSVRRPNGELFTNTEPTWAWFSERAAKAARWLGYVSFDRIIDERNAPPELFIAEPSPTYAGLFSGVAIELPDLDDAMPGIACGNWEARQSHRIILIGEKTSLGLVLRPIAEQVRGELLLPTGEISDTQLADLAARAVEDGRRAVVLYFSDFDPSGRQMPVSVARKLQASETWNSPASTLRCSTSP
jgi:hypothetical protein